MTTTTPDGANKWQRQTTKNPRATTETAYERRRQPDVPPPPDALLLVQELDVIGQQL